jgi:hypothetical protein
MLDPLRENLVADLPTAAPEQLTEVLDQSTSVRIERIVHRQ